MKTILSYFVFFLLLCVPLCYGQSSSSSATSSTATSAAASSTPKFDLRFGWKVPTQREDGEPLAATEIGGYEVRYMRMSDKIIKVVPLGPTLLKYQISNIPYDDYYIEIAVFDIDGLYSKFVAIPYIRPPMPVNSVTLKASPTR